jgi:hypothetical protein
MDVETVCGLITLAGISAVVVMVIVAWLEHRVGPK